MALSPKEKFFGLHSSPQAKLSDVISVRKVKNIWSWKPGHVITFNSGAFKQWVVTPDNTEEEIQTMFPGYFSAN